MYLSANFSKVLLKKSQPLIQIFILSNQLVLFKYLLSLIFRLNFVIVLKLHILN